MALQSRRGFVAVALAPLACVALRLQAESATQGLGQFGAAMPGCKVDDKPTSAAPEGPDFKPGSPSRTSLIETGAAGTKLVLSGTVTGVTCGRIKGALVDFWQADGRGAYDAGGFSLRGRQLTDANGSYRLETIVPGAPVGRPRSIHVKVQPPGKAVFTTQMFFPDDPLNAHDPAFKPDLLMTMTFSSEGKAASFNIVLNI
jgi:protocatechuate 3,4-dioxygenase beta subunit